MLARKTKMSLREAFNEWLSLTKVGRVESTNNDYVYGFREFLEWCERRKLTIETFDRHCAVAWIQTRIKRRDNSNYIKRSIGRWRRFFEWLRSEDRIKDNPFHTKYLPKLPTKACDRICWSESDYVRVLNECRNNPKFEKYWPLAVIAGWHTGARMSDIALLRWEQVDFENRVLNLKPLKLDRFGQKLCVPMEEELYEVLHQERMKLGPHEQAQPWVQERLSFDYRYFRTRVLMHFSIIVRNAGLPNHSFHGLRHAFVSRLINSGVEASVIGSMTGQSIETIQGYAHISMSAKIAALARARGPKPDQVVEVDFPNSATK
jgi:site-specific recombinase XerD